MQLPSPHVALTSPDTLPPLPITEPIDMAPLLADRDGAQNFNAQDTTPVDVAAAAPSPGTRRLCSATPRSTAPQTLGHESEWDADEGRLLRPRGNIPINTHSKLWFTYRVPAFSSLSKDDL